MRTGAVAALFCLLAHLPAQSADAQPHADPDVTVELPGFRGLAVSHEQVRGLWTGRVGESEVQVELRRFSPPQFAFSAPEQVTRMLAANRQERDGPFAFAKRELVKGPYGRVGFASLCMGATEDGEVVALGGLLDDGAYSVVAEAKPELRRADRAKLVGYFREGIRAECEPADPRWTDDEAEARWKADVTDKKTRESLRRIRRTKHYIIFTNSSGGTLFARKMEEFYKKIQKTFPFPEVDGRRLMPVFLFKTKEQYTRFTVHVAKMPGTMAAATKGHAYRDYYATYYESPNDPVHIHEATHQIFKNRLHLDGGGSWLQEGVAEYMCTSRTRRRGWARGAAKRGKHIGFEQFVEVQQLIANPHLDGPSSYLQAASLIEFLRDGKKYRDKFPEFLEKAGALRRGDRASIEEVLRSVYATDLDDLESDWISYWK